MAVLHVFRDSERGAGGGVGGSRWQYQRDVIIEQPLCMISVMFQMRDFTCMPKNLLQKLSWVRACPEINRRGVH